MIDATLPEDQKTLRVVPASVELVLAENDSSPLSLILKPFDDLDEMASLEGKGYSLKEYARTDELKISDSFANDFDNLANKSDKYSGSATYLNRLANLAGAIGNLKAEEDYLERARLVSKDIFFAHRRGANLIAQNRLADAELMFKGFDLSTDVQANLRLAYFHIMRHDLLSASKQVEKAISIDPLDYGARLFEGAVRLVEGSYERAIFSFRLAAEERPTSSALNSNLAIAYIALGKTEKAFTALRKAVALNPLNLNAITLLADLAFKEGCNEEAVPSLRYYLQFEQTDGGTWERLARSLLEIGKIDESIAALKRQGALKKTSAMWNNLGVAYHRRNDNKKALESFKQAMVDAGKDDATRDFFLAARNIATIFQQNASSKELLSFTENILNIDSARLSLTHREFADIIMLRIHALFRSGSEIEAVKASEKILESPETSLILKLWAVIGLLSWYSLNQNFDRALLLAGEFKDRINEFSANDSNLRLQLINNIAYTYAEVGNLAEAEKFLSLISYKIHVDSYPTATLGLLNLRKGNVDRGIDLYEEAIRIATRVEDKSRIRQKLSVEVGQLLLESEPGRAKRYLSKAIAIQDGEKGLQKLAKLLLGRIRK